MTQTFSIEFIHLVKVKEQKGKNVTYGTPDSCVYPRTYVGLETRGRARYLGSALETSPS